MLKRNCLVWLFLKRNIYHAIKSINETPILYSIPSVKTSSGQMQAWVIYHYGKNQQFTQSDTTSIPVINSPNDILIKVLASSINPIDIRRKEGYGTKLIETYQSVRNIVPWGGSQSSKLEFPLILGRDFCGEVVRKGPEVTRFNIGDKVYGALNITRQGSFAQYCVAAEDEICLKPHNISDGEASALPLVSITSWYAIRKISAFNRENALGKRALVLGAAGGVGHIAVQLLRDLKMDITGLCSQDSFDYVRQLGVEDVIDYRQIDWFAKLSERPKYDFIFDTVGPHRYKFESMSSLLNRNGTFVTIVTPVFRNTDKYGLISGLSRTAQQVAKLALYTLSNGVHCRWAVYMPDGHVLNEIKTLVEQNKLKIRTSEREFSFEDLPQAVSYFESGQAKGKVVIKYSSFR